MKIVVLDGYTLNPGDISWDGFKTFGDFTVYDRTLPEQTIERIGDAEIVYTNKVFLTKEVMDACPNMKYIGVLATGYNVVDLAYAKSKGIPVTNIPTYGTTAVAQYVYALLLHVCHHVSEHSVSVFNGEWSTQTDFCYWNYPLIELAGKTMGLIGFGRIGQVSARIAVALGMNVLAYDEYQVPGVETENIKYTTLDNLLANSDVISLHCPLTDTNKGLINKDTIAKMKTGAIVINTARGPLVVEQDMFDALESGKLYHYATDVVMSEPISKDNVLLRAKNCTITPHIAWGAKESRARLMGIAVDNLKAFLEGSPINVVN